MVRRHTVTRTRYAKKADSLLIAAWPERQRDRGAIGLDPSCASAGLPAAEGHEAGRRKELGPVGHRCTQDLTLACGAKFKMTTSFDKVVVFVK